MIKVHASYGLKVPADQEYSSQSYHATVEIELSDDAVASGLKPTLAKLWSELRTAVSDEITKASGSVSNPCASNSNGNGHNRLADSNPAPATRKQIGFLLGCARRFKNLDADGTKAWLQQEFSTTLDSLTKPQAGQIIDQLQAK